MLKSIMVGLDVTESARQAEQFALRLSQQSGARLFGISIVAAPLITAPQAAPLGASSYKLVSDAARLENARLASKRVVDAFAEKCRALGVPYDAGVIEDDPYSGLLRIVDRHDLVVIGRDTTFLDAQSRGPLGRVVDSLARETPRPMVITPRSSRAGSSVVIAYDGSLPAVRALQLYVLLGIARSAQHHVIAVGTKQAEVDEIAGRAAAFAQMHDLKVEARGIVSTGEPGVVLTAEAEGLQAELLVMGAYGRGGWRDFIWGSCTRHLMERSPIPIFVHH
jgi:nucleotide-binding universal stress UspA family protein